MSASPSSTAVATRAAHVAAGVHAQHAHGGSDDSHAALIPSPHTPSLQASEKTVRKRGRNRNRKRCSAPATAKFRASTDGVPPANRKGASGTHRVRRNTREVQPPPIGQGHSKAKPHALGSPLTTFNVVSINIDGITDVKCTELISYLRHHHVDICHVQETQTSELEAWFLSCGYHVFHQPPLAGKSGGCMTLVKECWKASQLPTLPCEGDTCWTRVDVGNEHYISANVYLRGALSDSDYAEALSDIQHRLSSLQSNKSYAMLAGDINVDTGRANDAAKASTTAATIKAGGLYRTDLTPALASLPTHVPWQAGIGHSHIDALAIDVRLKPKVVACGIDLDITTPLIPLSDHRPLWVSYTLRATKVPPPPCSIVFKVGKATAHQWDQARHKLEKFSNDWLPQAKHRAATSEASQRQGLADTLTEEVTSAMHKVYAQTIGTQKVRVGSCKVWSQPLTQLRHKKTSLLRQQAMACKRGEILSDAMADHLKTLRKDVKLRVRRLKRKKAATAVTQAAEGNTKSLWRLVNSMEGSKQSSTLGEYCEYPEGVGHEGEQAVATALTQKMTATHTYRPNDPEFDQAWHDEIKSAIPALMSASPDTPENAPFTMEDLQKVMKKLSGRESKQPGQDGIRYWMLTKGGSPFQGIILWLFNLLWEWECMPKAWGHSNIRYLYKNKGSKFDLTKYRPISLISCLGKAFTMLWLPRMEALLRKHLAPEQAGYMPGSGAVEALWTLTALIDTHVSSAPESHAYACFADTATAFDTVWRDGLYFILHAYGVRGKLLRMIALWHEGATATGMWYAMQSNRIQFSQGVRQGCVIAPLLYVVFINPLTGATPDLSGHPFPDLAARAFSGGLDRDTGLQVRLRATEIALSAPCQQFCDDVALLAPSHDSLQSSLDAYSAYARKWRYSLAPQKFHIVPFGKMRVGDESWNVSHHSGDFQVTSEPNADYLGVILDRRRTSLDHVKRASATASRQAPLLSRIAHNVGEGVASMVQNRKVDPSCLYGLGASWASDDHLKGLDLTVTAKCNRRAHLLPRNCKTEMALYESDTLTASRKVILDQARLAIKLARDPNPIRQALLKEMHGPRPPVKASKVWARSLKALKSAGISLIPRVNPPSKRRARRALSRIETTLRVEQQRELSAALPLQPSNPEHAAGSAGVFNQCAAPLQGKKGVPRAFCEWSKLDAVANPSHRRAVRKLRTGQLDCATRRAQWSAAAGQDLTCSCGAEVQDPYHVVLSCPHTALARMAVTDCVKSHAMKDSLLSSLTSGQDAQSILLASLGASLPGPWKRLGAGPYNTLVGLAAPMWAKGFSHLL